MSASEHGAHLEYVAAGVHGGAEQAMAAPWVGGQIDELAEHGVLEDIDRHFARLLLRLHANHDAGEVVALAGAVTSAMHRNGHICLDVNQACSQPIVKLVERPEPRTEEERIPQAVAEMELPGRETLLGALRRSPMVDTTSGGTTGETRPGAAVTDDRPLVLDGERLYLQRLFDAEGKLAKRLLELAGRRKAVPDPDSVIESLYAGPPKDMPYPEATRALRSAMEQHLCIITGGPGTGKTTLAAKLIAALVRTGGARPRRIALAAPTGKAAARIQESVREKLGTPPLDAVERLFDFRPEAQTLHRLLLGRDGRLNRLDALVIDECSMADLSLTVRVVAALPEDCRLILLGDAHQLASVEPGAVFSDLCSAGLGGGTLEESVAWLTKNHRFGESTGIHQLAEAIKSGKAAEAVTVLASSTYPDARLKPLHPASGNQAPETPRRRNSSLRTGSASSQEKAAFEAYARQTAKLWADHIAEHIEGIGATLDGPTEEPQSGPAANAEGSGASASRLQPFPRERVLCSHRRGPFGVDRFNRIVEKDLARRQRERPRRLKAAAKVDAATNPARGATGGEVPVPPGDDEFPVGRPILVTRNDRQTNLMNGDTGIVVLDASGRKKVWFPELDRDSERRLVTPATLPPHESFFALTVHRAQGSEYDHLVFIPGPAESRVNSRELFYTAVTRAMKRVTVLGSEESVTRAVERATSRSTGLARRLGST